jgi:chromosome segregation ATPase
MVAMEAERLNGEGIGMGDAGESAVTRLWRDRVQAREQERNEAQNRARIAEEKVAALTGENDRLARQNAQLSDQSNRFAMEVARLNVQNERLAADIASLRALRAAEAARSETEQQMDALKSELLSLLDQPTGGSFH